MSKEIKSTLELALERAAKLPKLTKEEIREQREKEYAPRGQAIASRFLSGDLTESQLTVEILRYQDEKAEIVRRAFLASMCQSIDSEEAETTAKVLEGIRILVRDDYLEEASRHLDAIFGEYERQKQQECARIEEAENARVRHLGISGSAIRVSLQENDKWRQKRSELRKEFGSKVYELKQELIRHLLR